MEVTRARTEGNKDIVFLGQHQNYDVIVKSGPRSNGLSSSNADIEEGVKPETK